MMEQQHTLFGVKQVEADNLGDSFLENGTLVRFSRKLVQISHSCREQLRKLLDVHVLQVPALLLVKAFGAANTQTPITIRSLFQWQTSVPK